MSRRKRNDVLVDVRLPARTKIVAALGDLGLSKAKIQKVLEAYPDGRGLSIAGAQTLTAIGLSDREARRVVAAFQVASACDESCRAKVQDQPLRYPEDVAKSFRNAIGSQEKEVFIVAFLNPQQRVIDIMAVAIGSLAQVDIHPREVFKEAVRRNAHTIIIGHNHPSDDTRPSEADIEMTKRMREVGKIVGIPVLDSLIVTPHSYMSFAERGLIESNPSRAPNPRSLRRSLV